MLWVPAVRTTDMIAICAVDGAEPAHPGEWPQARELGLEGGHKFGCFAYESDQDKWKVAGCLRCLRMAWRTGIGLQGLGLWRDWIQELSQDVLLTGLQRKRDFSAVFPPYCSLEGRLLISSETYLANFRWFINGGIHRGQMKHGQYCKSLLGVTVKTYMPSLA